MGDIQGIQALARYFADPAHDRDGDPKHVSLEELRAARGAVSAEADQVIDEILVYPKAYDAIAKVEREGWFNDTKVSRVRIPDEQSVSLRDLFATGRGTSYTGRNNARQCGPVADELNQASATVQRVRARFAAGTSEAQQRTSIGTSTFIVDAGQIFESDNRTGSIRVLPDSSDATAVLAHHGQLVAISNEPDVRGVRHVDDNSVWLFLPERNDTPGDEASWIRLDPSAKQVLSNGRDLLALHSDGTVSIYRGHPAGLVKAYRLSAFDDTGLKDVSAIANNSAGEIVLTYRDGRTAVYGHVR